MPESPNLPVSRPRPKAVPKAFPHNLPVQPTPFIGREQELSEIEKLLNDPSCRLLTLVGPGGIGKTRLALEAASQRLGDYPNGVWFVPFVGVSSPEHIVSTLADSLKLAFYGPTDPKVQILNYLKEKRMLLLWDNFEHLKEGAGILCEVLGAAPGVRCLVTSRELLKLSEERAFWVKGLDYPKGDALEGRLESYSAVKLFIQGAKKADPGFRMGREEKPFVARVCGQVEGMPLGIELASSWVRALSPKEIAQEMEKSLGFFATTQKGLLERHRSLKAVFEHSWGLLAEEERKAFRRMSVFRGGFGKEAAEKVCGAAIQTLASLIDKSFIRKASSGRYEVHELMRQFGEEKLKERLQEKRKVQDRHAEYYAEFLHERESALQGAGQKQALEEVGAEMDNVRSAWRWAVDREQVKVLEKAIDGLALFYDLRSWNQEGQEIFGEAAGKLKAKYGKSRAFGLLLLRRGWCWRQLGDIGKTKELLESALSVFRPLKDLKGIAETLYPLGIVYCCTLEFAKGKPFFQESLRINERLGDRAGMARSHENLGTVACEFGEFKEGIFHHREGLKIRRELGDKVGVAWSLFYASLLLGNNGRLSEAVPMLRESREIFQELRDPRGLGMTSWLQGCQSLVSGEYSKAKQLFQEALSRVTEYGDLWGVAFLLAALGQVALAQDEPGEAERLFQESLTKYKQVGDLGGVGYALCGLGKVSEARGEHAEAMRLYRESLTYPFGFRFPINPVDSLRGLGQAACALEDHEEAERCLKQALKKAVQCELALYVPDVLTSFAALSAKQGGKEKALELCALVLSQSVLRKETKDRAKRLFAEIKADLPSQVFAKARKQGEAKSIADAVEETLGERVVPAGERELRVFLLGPPKVLIGDREISDAAWGRKKAKKLFCYLALNQGKTFPCEVLAETFWPKLPPRRGLDNLYTTASAIRSVLKAEAGIKGVVVRTTEHQCGLDPKLEVWIDGQEVDSLLRKLHHVAGVEAQKALVRKAMSLIRGTFCEGWYDPWVVEEERKLCEERLGVLRKFGSACLEFGREEESIGWLEKAVGIDNYHEETFRNLMVAYARTGRRKALKEAFENLKQVLRKELRTEPERETVELYNKLMATGN